MPAAAAPGAPPSPWVGYAAALVFVGAAVLARRMLEPWLGGEVPLTLFILAVTASAWIGGGGPGLLATLASLIAAHVLSVKPHDTLPVTPAGYSAQMALLALAGTAISVINEKRRTATWRAEDAAFQVERRGAELLASQARFRRIVETAQEGIWHVDAEGRTVYANQHLATMLGYRPEELLGRSAFDLVPEEDLAQARESWSRRQTGQSGQEELRFQIGRVHV